MKELFSFENKNYLVTGASRGIGQAVAEDLLALGAHVWGVARSDFNEVLTSHVNFHSINADLSDASSRKLIIENTPEVLDGVFLNAGASGKIKPFSMVTEIEMKEIFELNFFSQFFLFQDLYKQKKIRSGTSIVVNTASGVFFDTAASSSYCGSKGALQSGFRSVAADIARRNIRINFIAFGYVDTELLKKNNVPEEIKSLAPLGVPNPKEVSGGVLYLLSSASKWLSGTTILSDSGLNLKKTALL
jgi:NAD(P)-dependent dehydrogenase (short-subunit alcohol dehydrogenase family)